MINEGRISITIVEIRPHKSFFRKECAVEKMPDRLFYMPAGWGFSLGMLIGSFCLLRLWCLDFNHQDFLKYKKELFYALAGRADEVREIPPQASIITGRFILDRYRRGGSVDSLVYLVNSFDYALSAFGNWKSDQNKKNSLLNALKFSGVFSEKFLRVVEDSKFNALIDEGKNVEDIKLILAQKIPLPEINYQPPGFPTAYAIFALLLTQASGYSFFIIRIAFYNVTRNKHYRWRDAPWGKPVTWILVIPGGLFWIAPYGILSWAGRLLDCDLLETIKSRKKSSSPSKSERPSDHRELINRLSREVGE